MTTYDIRTEVLEPQPTAAVRATVDVSDMPAFFGDVFARTAAYLVQEGAGPAGMPYARYDMAGERRFNVEAGFPTVRPVGGEGDIVASSLPGGTAAVTTHLGPYDGVAAAYEALAHWLKERGAEPSGAPWELYFSEPGTPPEQTRTDVVQPYREEAAT